MDRHVRIAVVDYGAGNLRSVEHALTAVGAEVSVIRDGESLRDVDGLVVPGVGASQPAMDRLHRRGLVEPIRTWVESGRPYLGICLGMQLAFDGSDEDGAVTLGLLRGRTEALENPPTLPHIGWNQVDQTQPHALFAGVADGLDFYFVHSFAGRPVDRDAVIATTEHGAPFVSAIASGPVIGVQFHPERSGADGLRVLANWLGIVRTAGSTPTEPAEALA
jgi:imidazole glycerol phosphate synthase glutamine amidotransferase subunit